MELNAGPLDRENICRRQPRFGEECDGRADVVAERSHHRADVNLTARHRGACATADHMTAIPLPPSEVDEVRVGAAVNAATRVQCSARVQCARCL